MSGRAHTSAESNDTADRPDTAVGTARCAEEPVPPTSARRTVTVDGVCLVRGSRVRLRPRQCADIFDLALTGRLAEVDAVEEDMEGRVHVAVTLEADEGRHFTTSLGHRFFFAPEEIEPAGLGAEHTTRLLVAGIGNIFLADDAFGPEVVKALRDGPRRLPHGVHAADFGIRGMDLAYRLLDGYDAVVFVDAAPRGGAPGTLYLIEPDPPPHPGQSPAAAPEAHGMDPVRVLALAGRLAHEAGVPLPRVLVLGCEPLVRMRGDEPDVTVGLSPPVRAAVGEAVTRLRVLTETLMKNPQAAPGPFSGAADEGTPCPRSAPVL
jgi:hydrogenase maturation protease